LLFLSSFGCLSEVSYFAFLFDSSFVVEEEPQGPSFLMTLSVFASLDAPLEYEVVTGV